MTQSMLTAIKNHQSECMSGKLCSSVIDGNADDADTSGKKSVANIIMYFMLLGSKPRGWDVTQLLDSLFLFDHPPIPDFIMTLTTHISSAEHQICISPWTRQYIWWAPVWKRQASCDSVLYRIKELWDGTAESHWATGETKRPAKE